MGGRRGVRRSDGEEVTFELEAQDKHPFPKPRERGGRILTKESAWMYKARGDGNKRQGQGQVTVGLVSVRWTNTSEAITGTLLG